MTEKSKIGVMLCGHGSRDPEAVQQFDGLTQTLRQRLPEFEVEGGYLEFARPIIREGLEALRAKGVRHILAVPGMLFAAGHVKNDLPWEVNSFAAEFPDMTVAFGRDLTIDPKLLKAAADRIVQCEAAAATQVSRQETLLLVVGRGTNDPDANGNVAKVTRMLWEGMGFGWAETAYSGVAYPLVDEALARLVKHGFKRIIVFPYFLFTGVLVRRIYTQALAAATAHPEIEILQASYLNDHPLVIESFVERVRDILTGDTHMNCTLCKYREQVIGYEQQVGAVQAGHHHHVRGIGTDAEPHPHHHPHDHPHHDHPHDHEH